MTPPTLRPTVVVVTWEGAHLLGPCLRSLRQQTVQHDVLVVDNASTDGTAELLARDYPEVRVLSSPVNTGFAGGVHLALASIDAEFVALLNNDAEAEPSWLGSLLAVLEAHPETAAVTSRLVLAGPGADGLNNAGVLLLPDGHGADRGLGAPLTEYTKPDEVFGFSGGAAMLRRSAVQAVGGFPRHFFLYYEDTDTSWRLRRAGWTIRYEPGAVVHHLHSATTDQRSPSFAFHNERNRLLTVLRNAPARVVTRVWVRYLLTTASLIVRRLRGQHPPAHTQQPGLRLRALGSALMYVPAELRVRRTTGHRWAPAGVTGHPRRRRGPDA